MSFHYLDAILRSELALYCQRNALFSVIMAQNAIIFRLLGLASLGCWSSLLGLGVFRFRGLAFVLGLAYLCFGICQTDVSLLNLSRPTP